jgi:hypothetical protein
MGCDIHSLAEKRSKYNDYSKEWEPILEPLFKADYYSDKEPIGAWNTPYTLSPYERRNYEVFSVLSNTRNDRDIKPIDEPRGYPDDMHEVTKWYLENEDIIDHSPSWLTIDEILNYPWDKTKSEYYPGKTLADSASSLLENIETLKRYAEEENCDVRIVFGYDS